MKLFHQNYFVVGILILLPLLSFPLHIAAQDSLEVVTMQESKNVLSHVEQDWQEYQKIKQERDRYQDLFVHLSHKSRSKQVLDQALYAILEQKITQFDDRLDSIGKALLQQPMDEVLLHVLPDQEYPFDNVDMDAVKQARLDWVNGERTKNGLDPFTYHPLLDRTAQEWAEGLADKYGAYGRPHNLATHMKPGQTKFGYDYKTMDSWFRERGIHSVVRGRTNHTENTGYGYYACDAEDCTEQLIQSIGSTFRYYMSEKKYLPHDRMAALHYLSIVGNFDYIGMGLTREGKRYYLVIHYMTEMEHPMLQEKLMSQWYVDYLPL